MFPNKDLGNTVRMYTSCKKMIFKDRVLEGCGFDLLEDMKAEGKPGQSQHKPMRPPEVTDQLTTAMRMRCTQLGHDLSSSNKLR